jgi:catalase
MTEPTLTTSAGAPVANTQNSLTASSLGPVLIEDHGLIETLARRNP